jgi:hypothetical protein
LSLGPAFEFLRAGGLARIDPAIGINHAENSREEKINAIRQA